MQKESAQNPIYHLSMVIDSMLIKYIQKKKQKQKRKKQNNLLSIY